MKKVVRIALSVSVSLALVSGFSGCASSAYQRALEEARRKIEEQKKLPLPPLPPYLETSAQYATSARILVLGEKRGRKLLVDALKSAGYAVAESLDIHSAAFNRADFILYSSLEPEMEYGDGSIWTRVRLVVSVRRPVTLGKDGRSLPSAPPRAFQAYARSANPQGIKVFTAEERLAQVKAIGTYKQYLSQENYDRVRAQMEESLKASDEQVEPAANTAVANLMRIAPFRELLAAP